MSVLGLDLSLTSTGYVMISCSGTLLVHGTTGYALSKATEKEEAKRINDITEFIEALIGEYQPKYVVIEGYAYNKSFTNKANITAELTGVVKNMLFLNRMDFLSIPATQARKIVFEMPVGVNSSERNKKITVKDKLASLVKEKFGLKFNTDDEVDAFILAEAIRKVSSGTDLSIEVIDSLQKIQNKRKKVKKGGKRGK